MQSLAVQLDEVLWARQGCVRPGEEKKADCLLLLLVHLYNYKVCGLPPHHTPPTHSSHTQARAERRGAGGGAGDHFLLLGWALCSPKNTHPTHTHLTTPLHLSPLTLNTTYPHHTHTPFTPLPLPWLPGGPLCLGVRYNPETGGQLHGEAH